MWCILHPFASTGSVMILMRESQLQYACQNSDSDRESSLGNKEMSKVCLPALLPERIFWYLRPSLKCILSRAVVVSSDKGMYSFKKAICRIGFGITCLSIVYSGLYESCLKIYSNLARSSLGPREGPCQMAHPWPGAGCIHDSSPINGLVCCSRRDWTILRTSMIFLIGSSWGVWLSAYMCCWQVRTQQMAERVYQESSWTPRGVFWPWR